MNSQTPPIPNFNDQENTYIELECTPSPIDLGKARAFHHAARLLSSAVVSRDQTQRRADEAAAAQIALALAAQPPAPTIETPSRYNNILEGEYCNMGQVMGGRKNREIKLCPTKVFDKGLETYKWQNYGIDAPLEDRPSQRQFTCVVALQEEDPPNYSADFATFCPGDARTQKSKECEGLILNKKGQLAVAVQKGPPDFPTFLSCMDMHHVSLRMTGCVSPPRLTQLRNFMIEMNARYPDWYPLLYQCWDRWMFEMLPEWHRLQRQKWDKRAARGVYQRVEDVDDDSVFNYDYPLDHLIYMTVKNQECLKWFHDHFSWWAEATRKAVPMSSLLEGDAPVANSVAEHASSAYTGQQGAPPAAPEHLYGKGGAEPALSNKKRKQMAREAHRSAQAEWRQPQAAAQNQVCRDFNEGNCKQHKQGPCGKFTCSKRDNCVHNCSTCGKPGHAAVDCYQGKGKGKADKGKGKNGKNKKEKKNKRDR